MRNCVDLSLFARTVDNAKWAGKYNSPIGLARLIACYEWRSLVKGRISRSDWAAVLNSKQQECEISTYLLSIILTFFLGPDAGNDAHAGYTLYKKFEAMMPLMPSLPKAAWYSFNVHRGNLCTDDERLWVPENPAYDPGPLPEPRPLTEAQLCRKRKKAEDRAAQQPFSTQVESGVSPLLFPIPKGQLPTNPGGLILSPQASMPAKVASGLTMTQVSSYHHSAGKQSTARNNYQDQHFQSTFTSRSGSVGYHPQNTAEVSQTRPSKRPTWKQNHLPRPDHIRDNSTTTGNP